MIACHERGGSEVTTEQHTTHEDPYTVYFEEERASRLVNQRFLYDDHAADTEPLLLHVKNSTILLSENIGY